MAWNEYHYTGAFGPSRVGSHNQRLDHQSDDLRISTRQRFELGDQAAAVDPQVNTDTLRDLLKALGHDIGDVWDYVVKLAKKAI